MSITSQIEELQIKATKYENMRQRYIEHAKEIDRITTQIETLVKQLKELRNHIDPVLEMEKRTRAPSKGKFGQKAEIAREFYQKILQGTHVTAELISAAYPDLDDKSVSQMVWKISTMPHVNKTKDGRVTRLYVSKET